jgi:hypothetical protein
MGHAIFKCDLNDIGKIHNTSSAEFLPSNHPNVTVTGRKLSDGDTGAHGGKGFGAND